MSGRALLATAAVCAASVLAGCGSSGKSGPLAWEGAPHLYRYKTLPRDGSVVGRVRGASDRTFVADARRVRLRDAAGRVVPGTARFLGGFAHGLYSPMQFGQVQNPFELQRLGVRVQLAPKQVLPLTVAWRLAPGAAPPVRIDYGAGSLPLPKG